LGKNDQEKRKKTEYLQEVLKNWINQAVKSTSKAVNKSSSDVISLIPFLPFSFIHFHLHESTKGLSKSTIYCWCLAFLEIDVRSGDFSNIIDKNLNPEPILRRYKQNSIRIRVLLHILHHCAAGADAVSWDRLSANYRIRLWEMLRDQRQEMMPSYQFVLPAAGSGERKRFGRCDAFLRWKWFDHWRLGVKTMTVAGPRSEHCIMDLPQDGTSSMLNSFS
jgi:hypothetical protein